MDATVFELAEPRVARTPEARLCDLGDIGQQLARVHVSKFRVRRWRASRLCGCCKAEAYPSRGY